MPRGSHVHRPPTPERSPNRARTVAGWAALVFGCLVLVTGLFRTGWLSATLLGVACIAIGLLLVWRIGSWRTVTPAALVLLALSGVTAPQSPVEETAEAAAASTTTSVVTTSLATTTATTTTTTTPAATSTTTSMLTTTPTTIAPVVMQTADPIPTVSTTRVVIPATTVASTTVYTPAFTPPPVSIETTPPSATPTGPSYVPAPEPTPPPGDPVYYEDCAAATAAGAAPVRIGEPGYGPHLDANNDGVGCEN